MSVSAARARENFSQQMNFASPKLSVPETGYSGVASAARLRPFGDRTDSFVRLPGGGAWGQIYALSFINWPWCRTAMRIGSAASEADSPQATLRFQAEFRWR